MITKTATIQAVAEQTGLSKAKTKEAINVFLDYIKEQVGLGNLVSFIGFGTFKKTHRDAREGRNPQTGETITIAASDKMTFKSAVKYN